MLLLEDLLAPKVSQKLDMEYMLMKKRVNVATCMDPL